MGGDFYSSDGWSAISLSSRAITQRINTPATTYQTTFTVTDDTEREDAETIVFSFGTGNIVAVGATPSSWTYGSDLTVTIRASDPFVRTLTVTCSPASVAEGASTTCTINLGAGDTAFTNPTAVMWAVTHGDTVAADFAANGTSGSVMFPTTTTFAIATADDNLDEDAESFTVQISVADATADFGTDFGDPFSVSIADNDEAGVVIAPAALSVAQDGMAEYTVRLATEPTASVMVAIAGGGSTVTVSPASLTFTAANWRAGETVTVTAEMDAEVDETATLTHTVTGTGEYASVTAGSVAVTITEPDDPAARAARVKIPLAAIAGGIGQLTAQAVSQRLRFNGASTFNLSPTKDLLRQGGFSLAHNGGGINLWGSGDRINAKGDDNGVSYDGDATALHLGADTTWRDGLLGIALAQSSGDTAFAANGIGSTLKTSIVSVHPYLTRTTSNAKLWATAGVGTGEAELRETEDGNRRRGDADLTLLSAAAGATLAIGDNASFHLGGNWSRAELAAATLVDDADADRTYVLPRTAASVLRLSGGVELSRQFGDWRPFVTVNLRRDSGDGDDGNAADYGGGVEWQNGNAHLRLAGRKHAQGRGPDEEHLTLTARKTAGRLNLGLNLGVTDKVDTANLLTGELRF